MQAIILCGGMGTRLGEMTQTVPKILLDSRGRTVLDGQISLLKEAGVDEVILASGHLHDVLYKAVGKSYGGMLFRYAKEEKKLDTGGALQHAMQSLSTSPFFRFRVAYRLPTRKRWVDEEMADGLSLCVGGKLGKQCQRFPSFFAEGPKQAQTQCWSGFEPRLGEKAQKFDPGGDWRWLQAPCIQSQRKALRSKSAKTKISIPEKFSGRLSLRLRAPPCGKNPARGYNL